MRLCAAVHQLAAEKYVFQVQILVQNGQIGPLAQLQAAQPAKMPSTWAGFTAAARTASSRGMPKDTALFMQAIRSDTEPARVWGRRHGGPVAVDLDLLAPEGVAAVGHAGGPQGVGDQDDPLGAEQLEHRPDHRGVDVHPVGDELHLHLGVSKAAPTTPGARWVKGGMALNRWVACRAPAS